MLARTYFQILPSRHLPPLSSFAPFKAIVLQETKVSESWRHSISQALCKSGCLYMMAWGVNCQKWDDSVDEANLEQYDFGDIPKDKFVFTTWHENETLDDVFHFAKYAAEHPATKINNVIILHIGKVNKKEAFEKRFDAI